MLKLLPAVTTVFFYTVTVMAQTDFLDTDTTVPIADDTLEAVTLSQSIVIHGKTYSQIFISENGMVTTEDGFYGGVSFPDNKPWIAPFGADIIPGAGTLSYGHITDSGKLSYVTLLVGEVYKEDAFTPTYALAVTWSDVIIDNSGQVNTFQLILASDGSRLYAVFILRTLESLPVKMGVSAGDGTAIYRLCYSDLRTHIQFYNRKSNAQCGGTSGVMVFRLHESTWNEASYDCTYLNTPLPCRVPGPADTNFALRCPAFVQMP